MLEYNFTSKTVPDIFVATKSGFSEMAQIQFEGGQSTDLMGRTKNGSTHTLLKMQRNSRRTKELNLTF